MPLCNHLSAHHNVGLAGVHLLERLFRSPLPRRTVAVDPKNRFIRPCGLHHLLNFLRSGSQRQQIRVAAGRAVQRNRIPRSAVVAHEFLFRLVINREARAMLATAHPAAGRARQRRCVPPAVHEKKGLFLPLQRRIHFRLKAPRNDGAPFFFACIDEFQFRQFCVRRRPRRHFEKPIPTFPCFGPRLKRRRR